MITKYRKILLLTDVYVSKTSVMKMEKWEDNIKMDLKEKRV
jgi:hypothetical protein